MERFTEVLLQGAGQIAGDTLLMRGGTYAGDFHSYVSGTAERPITFKPAPGEHVIIDGNLEIHGKYTRWVGLEMRYSGWTRRVSSVSWPNSPDLPNKFIFVHNEAEGTEFVACFIHDYLSVLCYSAGSKWIECVMWHHGWQDADGLGNGQSPYFQNKNIPAYLQRNFIWGDWKHCIQAYTQQGFLDNITFEDNVCFNPGGGIGNIKASGIFLGASGQSPHVVNPVLRRNITYGAGQIGARIGYLDNPMDNLILEDNRFYDGMLLGSAVQITAETGNVYSKPASGIYTFVVPRTSQANSANITILNVERANEVTVNVSAVLAAGMAYRLRSVLDYWQDTVTGVVAQDGTITVNMRPEAHSVYATLGDPSRTELPSATFPEFGAFIVEAHNG